MPFLTVNGVSLPIADGTFAETPREVGTVTSAFSGALRKSRRAFKRDVALETTPMTPTEAYAWEGMLSGQGDAWSFDSNLYSSKGTGPSSGSANGVISPTTVKYGANAVLVSGGPVVFNCGLSTSYTVMVWRHVSGTWVSYVICSSGGKWLDGVRNDAATSWSTYLDITPPSVSIKNGPVVYDNLVVLPYAIPDSWGTAYHSAGAAFGALPLVRLAGDSIIEGSRTALPRVTDVRVSRGTVGGVFYPNLRSLQIELSEA